MVAVMDPTQPTETDTETTQRDQSFGFKSSETTPSPARQEDKTEVSDDTKKQDGRFVTVSNKEIDRLYKPKDIEDLNYDEDLGEPGGFPFTRGIYETMYRGRVWTMRQFAGFGTPEETNKRYHYLMEQGQTGLSVAFDMPSLMGIDSDNPMSDGEVGKEGVAVDTLRDMEILFDGIPLDEVTVSFTINPSAPVIYAMYVALFDQQGISRQKINATFQNDMFKEFIAQKEWMIPPRPSVNLVVDTVEFAKNQTPKVKPISISGYHIREAGSTAVQELAFTLADGFAYVEACLERGMDVDEFAPQLSFFFNCHNSIFEEIAKFRAARRIWARVMEKRYGAKNDKSKRLKFHTQTAGQSLTVQQPLNNVVRTTLQALAAVLGGTQSLHTNSYDEAFALPTERAVKVALRTQQIIAEESGAADTVDPLGGSYFIESLTDETEDEVMELINEIEDMGDGSILEGTFLGIDRGWFQRRIRESAFEYQKQVENGDQTVVGVNKYVEEGEEEIDILHVDEQKAQKRQLQRLEEIRSNRSATAVQDSLKELHSAVENGQNTMPRIVQAVKEYATMGEIMSVFKDIHGPYSEY